MLLDEGIYAHLINRITDCGLSPVVETTLYRIALEALTNTAKHAAATAARVPIQPTNSLVRMVVETNGCGVDVEVVRLPDVSASRLGLYGMQKRAAIVCGTLTIESAMGCETTICVDVPMASETTP